MIEFRTVIILEEDEECYVGGKIIEIFGMLVMFYLLAW